MKSKAQSNLGHLTEAAETLNDLLNNEAYVKNYSTNLSTIYDELWMLEERRGNFKEALSFAKKRIEVSDSLYACGQNEMINEMGNQIPYGGERKTDCTERTGNFQ